MFSQV